MDMKFFLSLLIICPLIVLSCKNNSTDNVIGTTETSVIQNISVKDIPAIHNKNIDIKFLDVRTPEETAEGIISGALKIDYRGDNFKDEIDKLDRSQSYIVYCKSGGRSSKTADLMKQMGFKSIYNLEGGYTSFAAVE